MIPLLGFAHRLNLSGVVDAVQIGLDLLTTSTAATTSAGEEMMAGKNHKVGSSFLFISMLL